MANELSFTTRVDLSGLNDGFAVATQRIKSGSADMAAAMAASKQAAQNLSEAVAAFGAAAQAGNAQAKAAIEDYTNAAAQARSAVAALSSAESAETTVLRSNISARMAASASLRTMEGGIQGSTRAAGAFLTMLPGVGAALTAAFPVIGAIALGEVIVDVGEKLFHAFDIGGERARAVQKDIQGINNELNHSIVSLDVQIDKLDQERAKLEKKPFNGMKLVLDEAAESAQNLVQKLETVLDHEAKMLKVDLAPSLPQQFLQGQVGTKYESTMLEEHNRHLSESKNIQDQINESTSFRTSLQIRLNELLGLQKDQEASEFGSVDYNKPIQGVQAMIAAQQREQTIMQKTVDLGKAQASTQGAKDSKSIGPDPAIQHLRDIETSFAELNTKLPEEALLFWSNYNDTFKRGSSEYLHVVEKVNEYTKEFERSLKTSSSIKEAIKREQNYISPDGADEAMARVNKLVQEGAQDAQGAGEHWHAYWSEVSKGQEIATLNSAALQQANIAARLVSGSITKLGADEQLAGVHSAEFKAKLTDLNAELAKLVQQQSELSKDPMFGGTPGAAQLAGQIQGVKNQISSTQGQAATSAITDNTKITSDITTPFKSAFDTINNDWLGMQNKLIFGTRNVGQAFANMGVSILESSAAWAEKWLAKQAQTYLADKVLHLVSTQAKVGTDATAAVQTAAIKASSAASSQAVTSTSNVAMATSYAALAATGAAAAVAFIPLVGPALAPAAAAATFASTAPYVSLAAFETGGLIPNTGIAMVHQGEAVLPAHLTSFLMSSAHNSSTSNSSSANVHNHFHGSSDDMFRRQMMRSGKTVVKSISRGLRDMGKR